MLRTEGYPVELILVEGMSRDRAFQEYKKADIFVAQLLTGWYGGIAVEGMALGKPVICYLRYSDFDVLPDPMAEEIPIVNATPATFADVLRRLISDPGLCNELGQRGRAFVEKWYDPMKIAQQTKALYERLVSERARGGE